MNPRRARQRIEDLDKRSRLEQRLQALKDRYTNETQSAMETVSRCGGTCANRLCRHRPTPTINRSAAASTHTGQCASCCIIVKAAELHCRHLVAGAPADTKRSWLQLETIKTQHQGETLWTALQQDPAVRTGALLSERQARNEVKGFWEEVVSAMAQVRDVAGNR